MTVRKKLQRLGNSRVLLLDRDLLAALLPEGDLDAVLLAEVVNGALVVRPEGVPVPPPGVLAAAATTPPPSLPEGLSPTERLVMLALQSGPATRGEVAKVVHRAPETVSVALARLRTLDLVTSTGRDWRLTAASAR